MKGLISKAFPALESRNYRLYFFGQLVSLSGTWLQNVALGWLVLTLTNSAFWVGLIAAITTLPTFLFSLLGGVVADRFPNRSILIITKSSETVIAFILGFLTVTGNIHISHIVVLSFLFGMTIAFDAPARQAFAADMVEKKALSSAVALNAGVFNCARAIGPAVAGFSIAFVGVGGAFILNGVSYFAVLAGLLMMHFKEKKHRHHDHPFIQIKEGLVYAFTHPTIRSLLFFVTVSAVFGWSHLTILPVVARDILHLNASGLGFLYAASGAGSAVAGIIASAFSRKTNSTLFILTGAFLYGISLFLFTLTTNLWFSYLWLFLSGFGLLTLLSTLNATIQHIVPDSIRGRIMSVYVFMLIGMLPFGNFQVGFFGEMFGPWTALRICAAVVTAYGIGMFLKHMRLPKTRLDIGAQSQSRTDI